MLWTQLIIIAVLLGIVIYVIRADPSARHLAVRRLTVVAVLLLGVVIVVWPGLLTAVANLLGIGRGTDLLLYAGIIAAIIYVVSDYKKSVLASRMTTQLAREVALTEARLEVRIRALETAAAGQNPPGDAPRIDSRRSPSSPSGRSVSLSPFSSRLRATRWSASTSTPRLSTS